MCLQGCALAFVSFYAPLMSCGLDFQVSIVYLPLQDGGCCHKPAPAARARGPMNLLTREFVPVVPAGAPGVQQALSNSTISGQYPPSKISCVRIRAYTRQPYAASMRRAVAFRGRGDAP